MRLFRIARVKAAINSMVTRLPSAFNGWLGAIGEAFSGAWQRSIEVSDDELRKHETVWACQTLIASDIAKLAVNLIEKTDDDIWQPTENSAYSPVLRKPNHYQNRIKFFEQWMLSKLGPGGNTYVLKQRDNRGVVRRLYLLDPTRVQVLVAAGQGDTPGDVYYQLSTDHLSGINAATVTVPASEIIHDVGIALYHPLCGLSPIVACALAATSSIKIQQQSARFFQNNSKPGGVLTAPATIGPETAKRIQEHWEANYAGEKNAGRVAVLGDGLKYEPMSSTAQDSQLAEQLKMSDEKICSVHHVPGFLVGVGPMPTVNNAEVLWQQYYSMCLQVHIEGIELCLDEGLELGPKTGVEFDIEGLIRMDSTTKMKNATEGVKGAIYTPNYARKKFFNLPPMTGGDALYLQQQNFSLEALAKRDAQDDPFKSETPAPPAPKPTDDVDDDSAKAVFTKRFRERLAA